MTTKARVPDTGAPIYISSIKKKGQFLRGAASHSFGFFPPFWADFRCQGLLSLGRCCKSTRQGPFRSTFCSTRSSKPSDLLDRVLKIARRGPFRSTFCSAGSSKPLDMGRSDKLSARQGLQIHSTGAVQINFLADTVLKAVRQGPFRSTFWSVLSSKPPDKGRSDQFSARLGRQNSPRVAVQITFLLDRVLETARQGTLRLTFCSTGSSKPPDSQGLRQLPELTCSLLVVISATAIGLAQGTEAC